MENGTVHDDGAPQIDRVDKKKRILDACQNLDITTLIQLATSSGGLLQDDIRRVACKHSPFRG